MLLSKKCYKRKLSGKYYYRINIIIKRTLYSENYKCIITEKRRKRKQKNYYH